MDPCHPQTIAARRTFILGQQGLEPLLERANPRQRLHCPVVIKRPLPRPDRLAHRLARQLQIPRNRLDRLAARVLPPASKTVSKINILISPSGTPDSRLNHQNEGHYCTPITPATESLCTPIHNPKSYKVELRLFLLKLIE